MDNKEQQSFLTKIIEMLVKFLSNLKIEESKKVIVKISKIPSVGDEGPHVGFLQSALNGNGASLKEDDKFGSKTLNALVKFQKSKGSIGTGIIGPKTMEWLGLELKEEVRTSPAPVKSKTPWMDEMDKDLGKHETDKGLTAKLIPFWPKTGLNYKSLTGSKYAWCGLAVAAYLIIAGVGIDPRGYYRARNLDNIGVEIDYKTLGIPYGAVVTLNNKGNCELSKSNHATFSASECTPKMVNTRGAHFIGKGGNQNSRLKYSGYSIHKICAVRSPDPKKLSPNRLIKTNKRCAVGKVATESTR